MLLCCLAVSISGCGEDVTGPPPDNSAAFEQQRQAALATTSEPRFEDFRAECSAYHETMSRVRALEELMDRREATDAQINEWTTLSETLQAQRARLLATMAQERFSQSDREAMRWLMGSGN